MWVQRNQEEIARWHTITEREARTGGRITGGVVLVLVPLFLASGWMFSTRLGAVMKFDTSSSFWTRLPILIAIVFPFAWFIARRESKKELAKSLCATVCPKCDTGNESNAGTTCPCGGTFVLRSTVKWVDEEPKSAS